MGKKLKTWLAEVNAESGGIQAPGACGPGLQGAWGPGPQGLGPGPPQGPGAFSPQKPPKQITRGFSPSPPSATKVGGP